MLTLQTIPQPVRVTAKVNAENLTALITALASSGVVPTDLGEGKTLADVVQLQLQKLPTVRPDGTPIPPQADGTVAIISALVG